MSVKRTTLSPQFTGLLPRHGEHNFTLQEFSHENEKGLWNNNWRKECCSLCLKPNCWVETNMVFAGNVLFSSQLPRHFDTERPFFIFTQNSQIGSAMLKVSESCESWNFTCLGKESLLLWKFSSFPPVYKWCHVLFLCFVRITASIGFKKKNYAFNKRLQVAIWRVSRQFVSDKKKQCVKKTTDKCQGNLAKMNFCSVVSGLCCVDHDRRTQGRASGADVSCGQWRHQLPSTKQFEIEPQSSLGSGLLNSLTPELCSILTNVTNGWTSTSSWLRPPNSLVKCFVTISPVQARKQSGASW